MIYYFLTLIIFHYIITVHFGEGLWFELPDEEGDGEEEGVWADGWSVEVGEDGVEDLVKDFFGWRVEDWGEEDEGNEEEL